MYLKKVRHFSLSNFKFWCSIRPFLWTVVMLVATENCDPMGSAVFKLLDTDKQTDKQRI